MGYTHYWYLNKQSEEGSRFNQTIVDMGKIVAEKWSLLAGWDGEGGPEVGRNRVRYNGIEDDSHETFAFQRFGSEGQSFSHSPEDQGKDFSCCKTAQKPYDVVVVACLAVAAQVIGDGIEVSSDGDPEEWEDGATLASVVLGRKVPVPNLK